MFILVALLPVVVVARRVPWAIWLAYGFCMLAFLFAVGKATGVHAFMVAHLPLLDTFRVPGRIVFWIPLFSLPIWAWLFHLRIPVKLDSASGAKRTPDLEVDHVNTTSIETYGLL